MIDGITIITANMGNYDTPREQAAQSVPVDWMFHYDEDGKPPPPPWEGVGGWNHGPDNNLAAKAFKTMPPVDTRFAIWIDANMQITSPFFAEQAIEAVNDGVAVYRHPRRDCIYDEFEASIGAESQGGKYDEDVLRAQVLHYSDEGYPQHAGLYACGVVVWDRATSFARACGELWFQECLRWSVQDQLSFPVVCRKLGLSPGVFRHEQIERPYSSKQFLGNRWLRIWPHGGDQ